MKHFLIRNKAAMAVGGLAAGVTLNFIAAGGSFNTLPMYIIYNLGLLAAMISMLVGTAMIVVCKLGKISDHVMDDTIPNAKSGIRRTLGRAELDKALSTFLRENGGIWKLKVGTGDIVLYTEDGRELKLNAPALGFTDISESYAEHVARHYCCEIHKEYDTRVYGGGHDRVWVSTNINGDIIGGTEPDVSVSRNYKYSMLYSSRYLKHEKAESRKHMKSAAVGKRA